MNLSRDGAILTALWRNQTIDVATFDPKIGATYLPEARSIFDPTLTASFSTGQSAQRVVKSPPTLSTYSSLWTQFSNYKDQVSTLLTTGASASASSAAAQGTIQWGVAWLADMQQTIKSYRSARRRFVTSENTQGGAAIRQFLPTGAQITVSANGSQSGIHR